MDEEKFEQTAPEPTETTISELVAPESDTSEPTTVVELNTEESTTETIASDQTTHAEGPTAKISPSTPTPEPTPTPTKPATKPNRAFFKFRYILSLITGWSFYGLLAGLVSNVANAILNQEAMFYSGESAATFLAAFVVISTLHILLSWSVQGDEHQEQRGKILPIIYSIPLGLSACVFIFLLLSPLFQLLLGFGDDLDTSVFGIQCCTSIVAVAWVVFALASEFNLKNLFANRKVYTIVASTTAIVAIILFIAFPVGLIHGAEKDRRIMDDFSEINDSIEAYAKARSRLPSSLSDLHSEDLQKLHNPIDSYDYKITSSNRKDTQNCNNSRTECNSSSTNLSYLTYQLCATFHTHESVTGYRRGHSKGYDCIGYTAYGYTYDDDDYYEDEEDYSDITEIEEKI